MILVSTLKNFKAKVNQDIERSKEENGNKTDNYSQVVDSNLPKSFKLNIPLFKDSPVRKSRLRFMLMWMDGKFLSLWFLPVRMRPSKNTRTR